LSMREIATLGGGNRTHRRYTHKSLIRNDLWAQMVEAAGVGLPHPLNSRTI
jgi:hypothetical protein